MTKTIKQLQAAFFESIFDCNPKDYPADMSMPTFFDNLASYMSGCAAQDVWFRQPSDSTLTKMYQAYRRELVARA